jgi:hypothetical protein
LFVLRPLTQPPLAQAVGALGAGSQIMQTLDVTHDLHDDVEPAEIITYETTDKEPR